MNSDGDGGSHIQGRWGTGIEIVGDKLVLHCTDRNCGKTCDINTFAPSRRSAHGVLRGDNRICRTH